MELALSSAAAPGATLAVLRAACARRGLPALELVAGDGHGVGPDAGDADAGAGTPAAPRIAVYRTEDAAEALSGAALAIAVRTGAAIALVAEVGDDEATSAAILATARRHAAAGTRLLLTHGSDPAAARRLRRLAEADPAGALGLAWDADPEDPRLLQHAAEVLEAAGPHLCHVRLTGAGPEATRQEGRGVGALLRRLALVRYDGTLALAPSSPAYHYIWSAWLSRRRGWGCGSAGGGQTTTDLVRLEADDAAAGDDPAATAAPRTALDIRPVEPRFRFETIMGAYEALPAGGILDLTVDHDPRCMYYTLRATRGEAAFGFDYLESGPDVWRVEVRRRA
jgi:uncharacterized protein (DUF2249 family)